MVDSVRAANIRVMERHQEHYFGCENVLTMFFPEGWSVGMQPSGSSLHPRNFLVTGKPSPNRTITAVGHSLHLAIIAAVEQL